MKKAIVTLLVGLMMISMIPTITLAEGESLRPIIIQGAMNLETSLMMEALDDAEEINIAGYTFVKGTLEGYPVVVSKTQVGMVNAATTTTIAIMTWNPIAVLNQGTAGGHDVALHQGDIVLGSSTANINSFKSDWAAEGAGIDPTKWINRSTEIFLDGEIKDVDVLTSDASLIAIAQTVPYEKGNLVEGVIGSGDVWNKELDRISLIHSQFNTSCEEMETFSVAQVCSYFEVPFLGIRILSNNELHQESFNPQTGADCQEYVLDVVRAIIATL